MELFSRFSAPARDVASADSKLWRRIDGVDCLRALAIFLVLMNHVNMRLTLADLPYADALPRQLASTLFWKGQQGVQLFFAVSGFLIASMSLRRWGSLGAIRLRGFYAMRFARIAPLLLSLLAVLSALHCAGLPDFVVSHKTGGLGRALLAALTFHVGWLEATRGYLPGNWDILWSLGVEEIFYLGFPLIGWALWRGRQGSLATAAALSAFVAMGPLARAVWAGSNETWREYSYLGGMDAIALGVLTALLASRFALPPKARRWLGATGASLLIVCLCASRWAPMRALGRCGLDMSLIALGGCLLMISAAQSQWRAPRWMSPVLIYGRASYEIYLTHMFVVFALFDVFKLRGMPMAWVAPLFAATIALAGALGWLVAKGFSEPANRWLRERLAADQ